MRAGAEGQRVGYYRRPMVLSLPTQPQLGEMPVLHFMKRCHQEEKRSNSHHKSDSLLESLESTKGNICKFHFTFTHSRSEDGGARDGDARHSPAPWSTHLLVELSKWAGPCTVTGPQRRFQGGVYLFIDVNTQDALSFITLSSLQ